MPTTGPTWGSLPSIACSYTRTHPLPTLNSFRFTQAILSQTFTCTNTLAMSPLVTLDIWLTCSPYVDRVSKKIAQRMGTLGPLLNGRSDLSVRNRVLLYKQLIRLDSAWRSAACSNGRRLQVLQFKSLRPVTVASCYVSSRHIHEDLECSTIRRQHQSPNYEL